MNRRFVVGIRIFIVLTVILCVISGAYLFASRKINEFYKTAEGDVFSASMNVKKVFVTENENVLVIGSFLQGDNILENTSVFVKSFKTDGTLNETASIQLPANYSLKYVSENGSGAVILAVPDDNTVCEACVYVVTSNATLKKQFTLTPSGTCKSADFFAFEDEGKIYWSCLGDNGTITLSDESGKTYFETEITSDVKVSNVCLEKGAFYVLGSKETGTDTVGYVQVMNLAGDTVYAKTVMEDNVSVCTDVKTDKNGNAVIIGKYFDDAEYIKLVYPNQSAESAKVLVKDVADRCVSGEENVGGILVSSDFINRPWASYFVAKTDETGNISMITAPFAVSSQSGVCEFVIKDTDSYSGYGISRIAADVSADTYDAAVYNLGEDFEAGQSSRMIVPSDVRTYFCETDDGKLICVYGLHNKNGAELLSVKEFGSTSEFAKALRELAIYEKTLSVVSNLTQIGTFFPIAAVLLMYVTVRVKHAELYNIKE